MQTRITPQGHSLFKKLGEVYTNRELLFMLAWRDFRVRYAQTFVGVAWALFNPLINLVILSFVFNRVAGIETQGVPPLLYGAVGLVAWTFFAESLGKAGESLLSNQNMVRKIYFPRLALPLSAVLASLPNLLVSLLLVMVLMVYNLYFEPVNFYGLLVLIPLLFLAGFTAGTWISALTIRFRDFRFIVPVILRVGLFLVPIAYPVSAVPAKWLWAYFLNPLAGLIEGSKWALLGLPFPPTEVWLGLPVLLVLTIGGLYLFHRVERLAADYL